MGQIKALASLGIIAYLVTSSPMAINASNYEGSYINQEYIDYCVEIGEEVGICPYVLVSMIEHESSGRPDVWNGNCYGLCQVNVYFHSSRAEKLGVDLYDPYGNIRTAVDYLLEISDSYGEYGECIDFVLDVYNTGNDKRAMKNQENGTVCRYAKGILERSAQLEEYYYSINKEGENDGL